MKAKADRMKLELIGALRSMESDMADDIDYDKGYFLQMTAFSVFSISVRQIGQNDNGSPSCLLNLRSKIAFMLLLLNKENFLCHACQEHASDQSKPRA